MRHLDESAAQRRKFLTALSCISDPYSATIPAQLPFPQVTRGLIRRLIPALVCSRLSDQTHLFLLELPKVQGSSTAVRIFAVRISWLA
jgi:hypothetical protein